MRFALIYVNAVSMIVWIVDSHIDSYSIDRLSSREILYLKTKWHEKLRHTSIRPLTLMANIKLKSDIS